MKLLIQQVLVFNYSYRCSPESFEEDALYYYKSFLENECEILNEFSIHHTLVNNYTGCTLIIDAQKVSLDEIQMNYLFYAVFNSFDNHYKIEYIGLGGNGCDFCLKIENLTPSE